jgi:hypothetical protein
MWELIQAACNSIPVPATLAGSPQHTPWRMQPCSTYACMQPGASAPRTQLNDGNQTPRPQPLAFNPPTHLALLQHVEVLGHSGQHGAVGGAVRHAHLRYAWQYSVGKGWGRAALRSRQWRAAERCEWVGPHASACAVPAQRLALPAQRTLISSRSDSTSSLVRLMWVSPLILQKSFR